MFLGLNLAFYYYTTWVINLMAVYLCPLGPKLFILAVIPLALKISGRLQKGASQHFCSYSYFSFAAVREGTR